MLDGVDSVLNGFGVGLEVVGLGFAFAGAWQTWGDFAEPGEWPWSPVARFTRRLSVQISHRVARGIARLLRRPRQVIVEAGAASPAFSAGRARGRVGYGPLPHDPTEALRRLDERTRQLREALSDEQEAREDAVERLEASIVEATERVATELEEWRQNLQASTVAGLRLQFVGFPVVLVGLGLQLLASL